MPDWGTTDVVHWKEEARLQQQEYYEMLGSDWHEIARGDWTTLQKKVGFGIYGPPNSMPTDKNPTGYSEDNFKQIQMIASKLSEYNDGVDNASTVLYCVFISCKVFQQRFTEVVFSTKKKNAAAVSYVDTSGRVYSSWADYLGSNKLPRCMYCYPEEGFYDAVVGEDKAERVRVRYGTSPACDLVSRVFSVLDSASAVVALGTTGVGLAALCAIPIAGPIAAGAAIAGLSTGAYAAGRSGVTLYDRGTHGQTVAPTDMESAACWLSIVGSTLGVAQSGMLASMTSSARAGDVMGKAGRIAFGIINTGCLTVNGIGIVHGLAVLVDKTERNELTPLDVFQFTASVLFFTNSAMNLKSASTIIKEVQRDAIGQHRNMLDTRQEKKLFNKHIGKLRGRDEMHGNARVIKTLNNIDNKQELYKMMVHPDVDSRKVRLYPEGYRGEVTVNNELKIHPVKLIEIGPAAREQILSATKQYSLGHIDTKQFQKEIGGISKQYRIRFEGMRKETVGKLCEAFGKQNVNEITVNGKRLFANMQPREVDRLATVMANTGKNYDKDIVAMATKFAEAQNCNNIDDYCSFFEYAALKLSEKTHSLESDYQTAKIHSGMPDHEFDRQYGIQGKRNKFFQQRAMDIINGTDKVAMREMQEHFNSMKIKVSAANSQTTPGFFNDNAATYHYLKHSDFGPSGVLSVDGYFKLASDLVNRDVNRTNSMLSQEGNCRFITFKDPLNGAFGVVVEKFQNGSSVHGIATVMYCRDI